jgi:hypothetical protein
MYVVTGDRQLFMAFANLSMLGELGRQYLSGWANQTCVDTTFQFCNEAVNILTTGITEMQDVYHPTGAFIILDGSECFLMYCNSLTALEMAAHALIADVHVTRPVAKRARSSVTSKPSVNWKKSFTWPKHALMGDEHKGITKLADHFQVEHNRCIYHKTSKFALSWFNTLDLTWTCCRYCQTVRQAVWVQYFTNRDTYNDFYELISRAWQVAVPECKEHVHRSFIKWLPAKGEEGAARWFENQWEGKSWMLCGIGYSMAGGHNGQEGSHRCKRGATGGGGKNLNLPCCLSLLAQYMENHYERLESWAIAHGISEQPRGCDL